MKEKRNDFPIWEMRRDKVRAMKWSPMLAKRYEEGITRLSFPVMVQPKLDGVRALWDGEKLWSRSGKETLHPPEEILVELRRSFSGVRLDGELFARGLGFEKIVSLARAGGGGGKALGYHVFDWPEPEAFAVRIEALGKLFAEKRPGMSVVLVDTYTVCTMDELNSTFNYLVGTEGYEGQIIRDPRSMYEYKRTSALLKRKRTIKVVARVTHWIPGKGKHEGRMGALEVVGVGWGCAVGTGFSDAEREREESWWVGKSIVVEFQEYSKYGVPRFPRFVGVVEEGK